jgi:hypothetical protein
VEVQRPDAGDELLDALRAAARDRDPPPDSVRRRVHSLFVLSSLESGFSAPVGGLGRPFPPPHRSPHPRGEP